jgi:hypothetical protein
VLGGDHEHEEATMKTALSQKHSRPHAAAAPAAPASVSTGPAPARSLDDLAALSFEALGALYDTGAVPQTLEAVDGALVGRMLATRWLRRLRPLHDRLRRFARSDAFVWAGKSFDAAGPDAGHGINRIRLPAVLGRQNLFPFATRFAPSAIDGRPAIVLDYDLPENPPYIRKIHDEIREVSPGVYLGPAMWKRASGSPVTVLWFALDTGRR